MVFVVNTKIPQQHLQFWFLEAVEIEALVSA